MTLQISARHRKPSLETSSQRWAALIDDDIAGIDRDIEELIGAYRAELGCTRETASAALVRKLSSLVLGGGTYRLEETC
jgi:hypothetical protein